MEKIYERHSKSTMEEEGLHYQVCEGPMQNATILLPTLKILFCRTKSLPSSHDKTKLRTYLGFWIALVSPFELIRFFEEASDSQICPTRFIFPYNTIADMISFIRANSNTSRSLW